MALNTDDDTCTYENVCERKDYVENLFSFFAFLEKDHNCMR